MATVLHLKVTSPLVREWLLTQKGVVPVKYTTVPFKKRLSLPEGGAGGEEEEEEHDDDDFSADVLKPTKAPRRDPKKAARSKPDLKAESYEPDERAPSPSPLKRAKGAAAALSKPAGYECITKIGSMRVQDGHILGVNCSIGQMIDSTELLAPARFRELNKRLQSDGYIYLKAVVPTEGIRAVSHSLKSLLRSLGWCDDDLAEHARKGELGATVEATTGMNISGQRLHAAAQTADDMVPWRDIGCSPRMVDLYSGAHIQGVFDALARAGAKDAMMPHKAVPLSHFTWMRIKGPGGITPEHVDYYHLSEASALYEAGPALVYSSRGVMQRTYEVEEDGAKFVCPKCHKACPEDEVLLCDDCNTMTHMRCLVPPLERIPDDSWYCAACSPRPMVYTSWMPLGALPLQHGGLFVLVGSNSYGDMGERLPHSQCPKSVKTQGRGRVWVTSSFEAGDVVIFDVKTIHATAPNQTPGFRLSVDTRWCVYPERPNFGKTLSSQCVLNRGVPIEGYDVPV